MKPANPSLQIEGRSGCELKIIQRDGGIFVRKYSSNELYNERLVKQQEKQASFNDPTLVQFGFSTPQVFQTGNEGNLFWFEMNYVGGEKYSNYLQRINKPEIDQLINRFIKYFEFQFAKAETIDVPVLIIQDKIKSLETAVNNNAEINAVLREKLLSYLQKNIPSHTIGIGQCHGDLTLSNMLFLNNGHIVTFDLLDSFIESPVIDFVKLRQDTRYGWSIFIEDIDTNTRLKQVLRYLDNALVEYAQSKSDLIHWEHYLTVFNFARILPYAKDLRDLHFIENKLNNLI